MGGGGQWGVRGRGETPTQVHKANLDWRGRALKRCLIRPQALARRSGDLDRTPPYTHPGPCPLALAPPPPPHTPLIPQDPLDLSGRNLAAFDHVQRGLVADAEDRAAEEVRCALCAVRCALCAVRCAV